MDPSKYGDAVSHRGPLRAVDTRTPYHPNPHNSWATTLRAGLYPLERDSETTAIH
jgi:hypothetical protein